MAEAEGSRGRSSFSSFFTRKNRSGDKLRSPSPGLRLTRTRSGSDSSKRSTSPGSLHGSMHEEETDTESEGHALVDGITPDNAFEDVEDGSDDDEEDGYEEEVMEPSQILTFRNTAYNTGDRPVMNILESQSQLPPVQDDHPNMLEGEQPVFFVPSEPAKEPRQSVTRSKSKVRKEDIPLQASAPIFERNRCTITIDRGDFEGAAERSRRTRSYLAASDTSTESSYAIEWCIGTVLRDGDTAIVVSVIETDAKMDTDFLPEGALTQDLTPNQKDREERARLLARQVTALLDRTRLHVRVTCQAIHAKNAKHMIVDMIDYVEPTLVIIGSRGLNKIKGMLLGSVSYYLVQKSSVPVMVARRRLRRPTKRKSMATLDRQARVPLSQAEVEVESHAGEVQHEADRERTLELERRTSVDEGDQEDEGALLAPPVPQSTALQRSAST